MWPFKKFSPSIKQPNPSIVDREIDPVFIVTYDEVQSMNTDRVVRMLKNLMSTPDIANANQEKADIAFRGYDDTCEELFEIDEVREFVHKLDSEFPYWLFFLKKSGLGLQCIMLCHLLPHLTDEAKASRHPQQLEQILLNRWFPAMNSVSEFAGLNEDSIKLLTNRAISYFTEGPERA